ncbi:MAG TPA: class I SAM-dependent methyltransferase [Streptosporangiaceae bacterium]|nr:class I SAM-dependent methyltransferase [Streptosporangiaceae bacterium]
MPSDDLVRRRARQLAAQAAESGDPAGWFETLYAEARDGEAVVPWDDRQPNPNLTQWAKTAAERGIAGPGRRALVVGCGAGGDPAFLAGLGCDVTAFDVSPTAVAEARQRFPGSPVDFQVADLLAPPPEWHGAFDLVAEIYTVQALYGPARAAAIRALPGLVAAGGTLLVIARATDDQDPARDPALMPWPLTRSELESIAGTTLTTRTVEHFLDAEDPPKLRWRAEFTRPTA